MSSTSPLHARVLRGAAIVIPLVMTLGPVVSIGACNQSTNLQAKGGECFLASDCAPGLVCVEINKARVCTDDISGVAGRPPPEGGAPMEAGEGGDAPMTDGPPPPEGGNDTGVVDTGTDTAPPLDSGGG